MERGGQAGGGQRGRAVGGARCRARGGGEGRREGVEGRAAEAAVGAFEVLGVGGPPQGEGVAVRGGEGEAAGEGVGGRGMVVAQRLALRAPGGGVTPPGGPSGPAGRDEAPGVDARPHGRGAGPGDDVDLQAAGLGAPEAGVGEQGGRGRRLVLHVPGVLAHRQVQHWGHGSIRGQTSEAKH